MAPLGGLPYGVRMAYTKQQVLEFLRRRGTTERISEADQSLPEVIEIPRDEVLLLRLGVDAEDLVSDAPDTPAGSAEQQPDGGN